MIKRQLIFLLIIFCTTIVSAQKKNTWFRRSWSNMVAHYNVYYHGEKILNETIEDLAVQHKDDFSKPIEVYPYSDEATATSLKPKMEEVMKKASIIISKRTRSKWVDDCFLLLGKSHFFKGDMFAADEAFQFVNSQYSDKPIRYDAKLWIIKTLVRQGKASDAEALFKTFQREEKFPSYLQDDLNCVAGDIYTKMGLYKEAQNYLEAGLKGTKNKILKYRIHFLLAQLYLQTKDYDKARNHYRSVVKANSPYEFAFQSNIGIVKTNSLSGKTDTRESRRNLKKMLRDDKNIDYYDQLYFELGNLDVSDGNNAKAIKNYQSAIRKASKNQDLKANAYLVIAKIYYADKNYRQSQKFFDSTAMFITEKHPEYERIKLQQSILSTLIVHLITIQTQDSLLTLAEMPKDQLEAEIKRMLARDKDIKKKAAAKKAKEEEEPAPIQAINNSLQFAGTDQFIFDNQALLGKEYNEFLKRWGNRKLTDNWRIGSIKKELTSIPEQSKDSTGTKQDDAPKLTETAENLPEELKKYYANIPLNESDKALARKKILDAHFEAGKIYYEKLKEYKEAIFHFETVNARFPANTHEPDIFYYLVRCYDALSDVIKVKFYKNKLATSYPNSPFNRVFEPKDSSKPATSNDKNEKKEVEDAYKKMYNAFESGNFTLVKSLKLEVDKKYAGNAIQAKFDYLYALAVAKTDSLSKYIELLIQIKENYPGTEIGELAAYTLNVLENKNKLAKVDPNSIYKFDVTQSHFFCLIIEEGQAERLKTGLSNFNTKYYATGGLKIKSFLLGNKDMLSVEIFGDKTIGLEYYQNFGLNFKEFVSDLPEATPYFIISSENFKTLLREMDETGYLTFFKKLYL